MKWLQDNPLGMILAAVSGVFVLLALGMAIVGSLPVSVEAAGADTQATPESTIALAARQIGTLGDYQVVNEKPVFNESRQPVIGDVIEDDSEGVDEFEVKDAPDVKLTGVVITPSMKIASLTPANGDIETVRAHEGESLTGEFVGWQVAAVNPRTVILESRDGQSLELDLQVHDSKIQEPVAPVAATPSKAAIAAASQNTAATDEDGEPLSRAEQIRQRIAERRAELRQEQESQQPQNDTFPGSGGKSTKTKNYQSAIRDMMKNKRKDQGTNDNKDG
jgi:hypothetical protein